MATIRKRGGKWQAQIRRSGFPCASRSFASKVDAQRWARQMELRADTGDLPLAPRDLKELTVGHILRRYHDEVVSKKRSSEVEGYIVSAMLKRKIASQSLDQLSPSLLAKYRDQRLAEVQGVTVRRELSLLQHAFDIAGREWGLRLPANPVKTVSKPIANRPRDRRLEPSEYEKLILGCASGRSSNLEPLIRLALETGMRRGELLNIRWDDVDWDKRLLLIPETKNGHPRTIPLSTEAIRILETLPRTEDRAIPTTGNAIRLAWQRLVRRAGIQDLHFHDLRHEAISRFFEKGLSIPEVALISGHRDYRQLFRYTHLRPEDVGRKLD